MGRGGGIAPARCCATAVATAAGPSAHYPLFRQRSCLARLDRLPRRAPRTQSCCCPTQFFSSPSPRSLRLACFLLTRLQRLWSAGQGLLRCLCSRDGSRPKRATTATGPRADVGSGCPSLHCARAADARAALPTVRRRRRQWRQQVRGPTTGQCSLSTTQRATQRH
eukprot:COSAG01_NODE_856_length_13082_cov_23.882009_9_plen_166_part_00